MIQVCGPGRCTLECITAFGHCNERRPQQERDRGRVVEIRASCCAKHAATGGQCADGHVPIGERHLIVVRPLEAVVDELAEATRQLDTLRQERADAVRLLVDEDGGLQLARLRVQLLTEELEAHVKRRAAAR